jgi:hypothetical protein
MQGSPKFGPMIESRRAEAGQAPEHKTAFRSIPVRSEFIDLNVPNTKRKLQKPFR